MNRHEWRNIYCILHSLDAHEIKIPEDTPTEFDWPAFRDNPHQYLLKCSDGVAELIWKAVEKRLPNKDGEHVKSKGKTAYPSCYTCIYYSGSGSSRGNCRRDPPKQPSGIAVHEDNYPKVLSYSYCGKWMSVSESFGDPILESFNHRILKIDVNNNV